MGAALILEHVGKRYGAFQAVKDLSFEVQKGEICGFLGPNGAGKTSTIRMILGLTNLDEGRISILGARDGRRVRDRLGFLPEERGLYKKMTPVDAIAYFGALKGLSMAEGRKRARGLLERQGLSESANKPLKALSKGMAQKVQLAAAVVHEPEFVILDEPFSGLDPVNQQGLEALIRDLARGGATVLFSTHVMQHAERLCDRVVLLAKGQKAFEGTVREARASVPRTLEMEGPALDAAALAALPGVIEVEASPEPEPGVRAFRISLAPGAATAEVLKAAFGRGFEISRFDVREASLHDAFIRLTGIEAETGQEAAR
ncbi:ATP-binding cassette domain-containing protein [Brevundimonas sp. 2R-24]|uniref:ATP-binding cassette domain-containing protein n=1 Tax=Peiella sedimenti TaxID=3061083 RepID=A0ABT8SQ24_9CAUL|nr:ATP-binding cassette domain-containing protein [Caulobacteraceae bacterium XZ-24]